MKREIREKLFALLPQKVQKMRTSYVKGKIGEGSRDNVFLYDNNLLCKLRVKSYSTFGEDAFIFHMIFGGMNNGFFVELGGYEPILYNNSYLLEQNGWTGLAFEPIRELADKWKTQRKTPCYNMAIGDAETEVEFIETRGKDCSLVADVGDMRGAIKNRSYKVRQRRLENVLEENGIVHVDVMFLDVEGYEMNVLKGIDFNKVNITCVCVENNRASDILPDINLREYLLDRDYILIARLTINDVFVKKNYFKKDERQ